MDAALAAIDAAFDGTHPVKPKIRGTASIRAAPSPAGAAAAVQIRERDMGLSNIDISAHGAVSLEADCWSRNGSNCLTLVVKMGGEQETEVSIFFRGPHAQPAIQIYAIHQRGDQKNRRSAAYRSLAIRGRRARPRNAR